MIDYERKKKIFENLPSLFLYFSLVDDSDVEEEGLFVTGTTHLCICILVCLMDSIGESSGAASSSSSSIGAHKRAADNDGLVEGSASKKARGNGAGDTRILTQLVDEAIVFSVTDRTEVEDRGILREYPLTRTTEFHCDICGRDVTHEVRIKCHVSEADICLECFKDGKETSTHKANMPYSVIDNLTEDLHDGWEVAEELALLEGLRLYGIGNWDDISTHIGTRNSSSCKQHYWRFYLGQDKEKEEEDRAVGAHTGAGGSSSASDVPDDPFAVPAKATGTGQAKGGAAAGSRPNKQQKPHMPGHDISGYLPLRGDFEVEHDNNAELAIADMDFPADDNPLERSLKLKIIEMYNAKLDERERRKKMVERYGLLEFQKLKAEMKKRPKEERDVYDRMRVFARFLEKSEHDQFVENLIHEMRLRKRIDKLREYRENGIRTLQEGQIYDLEKQKRDQEAKLKKHRAETAYLFKKTTTTGGAQRSARYAKRESGNGAVKKGGTKGAPPSDLKKATAAGSVVPHYDKLDVSKLEGVDKLDEKEREMCSLLRLPPSKYLIIKETLVKECLKQGVLSKTNARRVIQMDVKKSGKLYDFFVDTGLIA
jgi:transcriptional adapter 2-alpha